MTLGLGIDTGGTYTDSVIVDMGTKEVLSKSKSMTTREDLSLGIRSSLEGLDKSLLQGVDVAILSSTLATNSVVEGKGCRVALICVGGEYDHSVPVDYYVKVAGGHDINGDEIENLDVDAVKSFLESIRGRVDGLAVSSYMSVRNPSHENRVRTLARSLLNIPVACGHELSTSLGFSERATTCVMNSKLVPVMDELIDSVENVLRDLDIDARLMIFRGDGSVMNCDVARERPVETIISGPAASLVGAMTMTGITDAVVMDIGGTTTDIGILRDGRPNLEADGATIAGKRTHVMAPKVFTSGIGGDSRITVDCGRVSLLPQRVMPLCVAAKKWDCIKEQLRIVSQIPVNKSMKPVKPYLRNYDIEFLRTLRMPREGDVEPADMELLRFLSNGPGSLKSAALALGRRTSEFNVSELESYGYLQRIGLTPTDILHVSGDYREFDVEASEIGVAHLSRLAGTTPEGFVAMSKKAIRDKLSAELMTMLLEESYDSSDLGDAGVGLVSQALSGRSAKDFTCTISLDKPIIGMGASSGVYIRWLSDVFDTDVVINEYADVGNAIGAITATVSETVEILVRPVMKPGVRAFETFSRNGRNRFATIEEAIDDSVRKATDMAVLDAERNNATDITTKVECDRHEYVRIGNRMVDEAIIRVTATGNPSGFGTAESR